MQTGPWLILATWGEFTFCCTRTRSTHITLMHLHMMEAQRGALTLNGLQKKLFLKVFVFDTVASPTDSIINTTCILDSGQKKFPLYIDFI